MCSLSMRLSRSSPQTFMAAEAERKRLGQESRRTDRQFKELGENDVVPGLSNSMVKVMWHQNTGSQPKSVD